MLAAKELQAAPLDGATKMMFEVAIGLIFFVAASGSGLAAYRFVTRNFEVNPKSVAVVSGSFAIVYHVALWLQQHHV